MKIYVVSLCKEGILGGLLYLDDKKLTYRTGKITVSPELRNLQLPLNNIKGLNKSRLLGFPTVGIKMKNGEFWKFIVFCRKRFLSDLKSFGIVLQDIG